MTRIGICAAATEPMTSTKARRFADDEPPSVAVIVVAEPDAPSAVVRRKNPWELFPVNEIVEINVLPATPAVMLPVAFQSFEQPKPHEPVAVAVYDAAIVVPAVALDAFPFVPTVGRFPPSVMTMTWRPLSPVPLTAFHVSDTVIAADVTTGAVQMAAPPPAAGVSVEFDRTRCV